MEPEKVSSEPIELRPISITPGDASMLYLFLRRLNFDHFLDCSDGDGDEDQAYAMQASAKKLREELEEFLDQFVPF